MKIPLSNINLSPLDAQYVIDALGRGWLSGTGDYIPRVEAALCERIDRAHCIVTANGTLALELALRGLGIGPGDEVLVPALTFAAPAAAVCNVGATPVFVDVHPVSWTIDPDLIAERMSHRTRAVIAVDILGHPADYDAIRAAVGADVKIIQDAAEAHGARYKGELTGKQGDVSIFSFHANKAISCGEGGCVLTDDADLAKRMRVIANHGMTAQYWHDVVGSNTRMGNLYAAVLLGQVERWDELISRRNEVAGWYDEYFDAANRRPMADWAEASCWLYVLQLREPRVFAYLTFKAAGIDARQLWRPLPEMPPYRDGREYPVAADVSSRVILLPTWIGLELSDIELIAGGMFNRWGEDQVGRKWVIGG